MAKKENRHAELVSASANIEAPYELPEGWNWEKLGNLFSHTTGKALNKENTVGALKKYITTSNLYWNTFDFSDVREMYFTEDELEKCTATKGDLLICNGGDVGRAAIWNFDYDICIQNHISKLRKKSDSVSTEFFYYIFLFYKDLGLLSGKGIGIASLSAKTITNLIIPLPPTLAEQQRIVNRIETMFAKLDQAQEKAQTVLDSFETRKAAILHKAFSGELTANWRKENGVADDSWVEKTVGDCFKFHSGDNIKVRNAPEGEFPIYGGNGINGFYINSNVDSGTIVVGRVGFYCGSVHVTEKSAWVTDNALIVSYDKNQFVLNYVFHLLKYLDLGKYSNSSAQPVISGKTINPILIKYCTLPEQQEIVRILDTVLEKETRAKEATQTVLDQIALLKKSILARAFRGEL